MNIYTRKQRWKLFLFIGAVAIGLSSLWYTNRLTEKLAAEERKKAELWAEGMRELVKSDPSQDISFIFEVIKNNETVPVMLVDENGNIISMKNIDSTRMNDPEYLQSQLKEMKNENEPIKIQLPNESYNLIYYRDSILLSQLFYYPFIQLGVIFLFILVSYFAFSASRKAEQNQVWVGMAKETAHQLGTPISSLLAWKEILEQENINPETLQEIDKDISRLGKITERFSKIGASPDLSEVNIIELLTGSANYMQARFSKTIRFVLDFDEKANVPAPVNASLFEWVIENLFKNAIDAMTGKGTIIVNVREDMQNVIIDISDTGKGVPKSKHKTIFQPGYTTKQRGWGLGLSLSRRIIEFYHEGKIFVKHSEINKGTTFRIVLRT